MIANRLSFLVLSGLLLVMFGLRAEGGAGPPERTDATEAGGPEAVVSVFYVTNRKRYDDRPAADTYGGERGEPSFGRCEVQFAPIPIMDQLARNLPFYVPAQTHEILLAEQSDRQSFWARLSESVSQSSLGSVVVFIHGYNYGFDRTCRMAAELQRRLQGKSTVVMFSWPSNANPAEYVFDQVDVDWSVPFLAQVLAELSERVGQSNVQMLAHSMGSRGTIYALERLRADRGARPIIGDLVLLAPDFDSQTFIEFLPRLTPMVRRITLYASSNDNPLKVSRRVNGHPRLGEAGEFLTIANGMETIDVSDIGRYQILGHEYFYYHPLVVADLVKLLTTGKGAAQRPGLRSRTRDGQAYWEIFQPDGP